MTCFACAERMPLNECPLSPKPCGHHCDCSWTQDICHFCSAATNDDGDFVIPARAKPAPSDLKRAQQVVDDWIGDSTAWVDTELKELRDIVHLAIADAVNAERERCAQLVESHKTAVKDLQSTWKRVTFTILAAAIRVTDDGANR